MKMQRTLVIQVADALTSIGTVDKQVLPQVQALLTAEKARVIAGFLFCGYGKHGVIEVGYDAVCLDSDECVRLPWRQCC